MIARLDRSRERFDAILLDLDGTLMDPSSRITPRAQRAVADLLASGYEVLLCTGRSYAGTVPMARSLGLDTAIVAYNGAWIARADDEPWRYATIPDALLPDLERFEERAGFSFRHDHARKASLASRHVLHRRVADWYHDGEIVSEEASLPREGLLRVSCYFDDIALCDGAWSDLRADARAMLHHDRYPMSIFSEFADSGLILCEIQVASRGKAEAFCYLWQERGIESHRVIAVGDHVNDVAMLEQAGLGVAMGNAVPAVKAAADLVIGCNGQDGVAAWIEAGLPTNGAAGA